MASEASASAIAASSAGIVTSVGDAVVRDAGRTSASRIDGLGDAAVQLLERVSSTKLGNAFVFAAACAASCWLLRQVDDRCKAEQERERTDRLARILTQRSDLPPVSHDIMLRAARGEKTERAPVWAMRQAGRYLPEFLKLQRFNFLERVHAPELSAEITLQPLRRFRDTLDAVVIFSDILIVPPVMGFPVVFEPGPKFIRRLRTPTDLSTVRWRDSISIHKEFKTLLDAITRTRRLAAAPLGAAIDGPAAATATTAIAAGSASTASSAEAAAGISGSASSGAAAGDAGGSAAAPSTGTGSASPSEYAPFIGGGVGKAVPVIGFVGAPWTLMSYMIDGDEAAPGTQPFSLPAAVAARAAAAAGASSGADASGVASSASGKDATPPLSPISPLPADGTNATTATAVPSSATGGAAASSSSSPSTTSAPAAKPAPAHREKNYHASKQWLIKWPESSHRLLDGITAILVDLLVAQYQAGASILQVFETNADQLSPHHFRTFALPYLAHIAREVRARTPPASAGGPVLILFAKGAHYALDEMAATTDYHALSIDWSIDPAHAVQVVTQAASTSGKPVKVLQGNLDPCELFGTPGPAGTIRAATQRMMDGFGAHPIIGNLGHGMLPGHTPEALGTFFDAVHEISREQRRR